jgi:glycosyltransferase involved in cell wall biosynthesis
MNLAEITPLILTWNEEANIARTLAGLNWARQIVVVDSGSTDRTLDILGQFPSVRVGQRTFDNFAAQCNFGLTLVTTSWTLSIDADYCCPPELQRELESLPTDGDGFECRFIYSIFGNPLRSTLYPPRVVLFRTKSGRYDSDGHAHRVRVAGNVQRLKTPIFHDDRKPLARWLAAQSKYADLEVKKLLAASPKGLSWKDRLRKRILFAAPLTFVYCLLYKRLILDGWPGIYYSLQRTFAEFLLSLKLLDATLTRRTIECEGQSRNIECQSRPAAGERIADGGRQTCAAAKSASATTSTIESAPSSEQPV